MRKLGIPLLYNIIYSEGTDLASKISLQMNNKRYSNYSKDLKNITNVLDTEIKSVLSLNLPFDLSTGFTHFKLANKNKTVNKKKIT
jgi:hypothetical protein